MPVSVMFSMKFNLTTIGEVANALNPLWLFLLPLIISAFFLFHLLLLFYSNFLIYYFWYLFLPATTEECKLLKGWYIFHSLDMSDNERKINKTVPDT